VTNSTAAPAKPGLLRNPLFDQWASGDPTEWTHTKTNATYSELNHSDPETASSRTVFARRGSRGDYIYASNRGFRVTLASAAAAGNWIVRQDVSSSVGVIAKGRHNLVVRVVARCNTEFNVLRCQVIGIVGTTDTYYLVPVNTVTGYDGSTAIWTPGGSLKWSTTNTNRVNLTMLTKFNVWGIPVPPVPIDCTSVSVLISNGTAGSQVIDVGEFAMEDRVDMLGGQG
jgi:hypothetical protein